MCANYCFIAPILPGGMELIKKWNEENIVNNKEHDIVFKFSWNIKRTGLDSTFATTKPRFCSC